MFTIWMAVLEALHDGSGSLRGTVTGASPTRAQTDERFHACTGYRIQAGLLYIVVVDTGSNCAAASDSHPELVAAAAAK
jgi:hypothetical protein